jgi:two-component system sensor histidine kinase BarA
MKGQKGGIPVTVYPDDHNVVVLGHELGNVLNGLLGMAELLGESGLNAEQDRWLKAIQHSGRQMQSLIQAVRLFQGESGLNIVQRKSRVDGMEILEQVVTSHTPAARSRRNRLLLVTDPGLPRYWHCDSCLVRQLLDNVVGNAIKFTNAGEVVIEVASTTAAGVAGEMLEIRITDTGPGFETTDPKHIFGAYQRGRSTRSDKPGDRGLGLFICRKIVLAMNGRISCFSPKEGGARFEIVLPEALIFRETHLPHVRSSLLERIRCQLKLRNPLRRSVENFLDRLGVRWSNHPPSAPDSSGHGFVIVISNPERPADEHVPGLLLTPQTSPGPALHSRTLEAPVLESNLGKLLLEIALQWRGLRIRNENPG